MNNFCEKSLFNLFCVFLLVASVRVSAASVTHTVDVRVVHAPSELSQLSSENDKFKLTFEYNNDVVSNPPKYNKDGVYSGPQHKYRQASRLVKIEKYESNIGSLSFNNIIESFELGRIATEPPTNSLRTSWKSKKNGGVRVFIEFNNAKLKQGDSPTKLKNQLLEPLNNSGGVFHFQFTGGVRISGVFVD